MRSKEQFELFNKEMLLKEKRMKEQIGNTMKREYINVTESGGAIYYTGLDVEKTPTHGMETLFVIGIHPIDEIIQTALQRNIKCVYFGANNSFNLIDEDK